MYQFLEEAMRTSTKPSTSNPVRRNRNSTGMQELLLPKEMSFSGGSKSAASTRASLEMKHLTATLAFTVHILLKEVKPSSSMLHVAYPEALRHFFENFPPNSHDILNRLLK